MAETPYTQPRRPNVIKRHKSDAFQNPSSNWFKMTFVSGSISGYLLSQFNKYPDYQIFLVAGALALGLMWLKSCGMSPRKADKSMIKFWYFVSEIRGKHVMHKLTSKDNDLRTVYPLVKIYEGRKRKSYKMNKNHKINNKEETDRKPGTASNSPKARIVRLRSKRPINQKLCRFYLIYS